jgi:hypothetical protein
MPDEPAGNPDLLRSLGRLVRGLSALFWALPVSLVICAQAARTEFFVTLGPLPPLAVTGWIVYGLWQLSYFQRQERVWMAALDRARVFALVNFGLSPFLIWWGRTPGEPFFGAMVAALGISALLFLGELNVVLLRLTAMLPEEHLRQETRYFSSLNRFIVLIILICIILLLTWWIFPSLTPGFVDMTTLIEHGALWVIVFLVLLPLAMTMALLWKIKEVILEGVFSGNR